MKKLRIIIVLAVFAAVMLVQRFHHVSEDLPMDEMVAEESPVLPVPPTAPEDHPPEPELKATYQAETAAGQQTLLIDAAPEVAAATADTAETSTSPVPPEAPQTNPPAPVLNATGTGQQTLFDRLVGKIDRESLEPYLGSYTWDDLAAGSGESTAYSINSGWIWGGSNTPKAGLTVRKNPQTGEYGLSGGEVFLPGKGIGFSYEKDPEKDETRAFLNLKKEF